MAESLSEGVARGVVHLHAGHNLQFDLIDTVTDCALVCTASNAWDRASVVRVGSSGVRRGSTVRTAERALGCCKNSLYSGALVQAWLRA
ncbi:uncharacterized protein EMH_0018000 [Eimeria mitis]|uniref:Uncharacterized protein n=1 Tax=Eimeria mitis TaxID=44415 RepID=U6K7L0_9EIME|nr:uncharacterized protein EMH_0018000 [Eimeria mitis]CDJ33929.1 hypothetical protein EMH_0018000 [Eimeria mitis]